MTASTISSSPTIVIRPATAADGPALVRLAELDSSHVPFGPVLLAEVDGEPRAALALRDGHVVADPFVRTAELVEMLRVRAAAVTEPDGRLETRPAGAVSRLRPAA